MVLLKSIIAEFTAVNPATSTFHYGSIKIITEVEGYTFKTTSTFHYGSIKMCKC